MKSIIQEVDIVDLASFNDKNTKDLQIVVNKDFCCTFEVPDNISVSKNCNYYFLSPWKRAENFPGSYRSMFLKVFDPEKMAKFPCCIEFIYNADLSENNRYSGSIFIYDKEGKNVRKSFNITNFSIEPRNISINSILRKLDVPFNKTKSAKSPEESLGLSVISFENDERQCASLEYDYSGRLYFEVLDLSAYKNGDDYFMPLDSPKRNVVVNYVKVTNDNIDVVTRKINDELSKLFSK